MWYYMSDIFQSSGSFEFIKVSIIGTFWFLLENFGKKDCVRPVFLEELQAARNFSKVSLHFNKIPNYLRQFLQAYSKTFCVLKNCPPELVGKD